MGFMISVLVFVTVSGCLAFRAPSISSPGLPRTWPGVAARDRATARVIHLTNTDSDLAYGKT